MVFQHLALFPMMNVADNIGYGLRRAGLPKRDITRKVGEVLERIGLPEIGRRRVDELSGGQKQRVAIARCMVLEPDVLLLDEPLGALDAKLRGQVQKELKSIQQRTHKTFFFVTHDQEEALTMSDRIVVMNKGQVEQDGTPEELYFHPASRFVAEFIGETNLLSGEVRGVENGDIVLDWHGRTLRGRSAAVAPRTGETITASIRLERVSIRPDGPQVIHK